MSEPWVPATMKNSDELWAIVDENGQIIWIQRNNSKFLAVFHSQRYAERILSWLRGEVERKLKDLFQKKENLSSLSENEQTLVVCGVFYFRALEDMLRGCKVVRISLSYSEVHCGESSLDSHTSTHKV
jgi:hypothetical protein